MFYLWNTRFFEIDDWPYVELVQIILVTVMFDNKKSYYPVAINTSSLFICNAIIIKIFIGI
jgi:hypothetical protein